MRLTMRLLVMAVFVVGFFCACGCSGKLERAEAELCLCRETVADTEAVVKELKSKSSSFETALNLLEMAQGQCTGDGLTGVEKLKCFNSAISTVVNAFKDKGTAVMPTIMLEQLKAGNPAKSNSNEPRAELGQPDAVSSYWSTPEGFAMEQALEYRDSVRHTLIGDGPTMFGKY